MFKDLIDIAIIDDGINEGLFDIGDLKYNIEITSELNIIERKGYNKYLPSHATTCAAIIRKYSPYAVLSSIKILNNKRRGLPEQLVKSIEWCADVGIRIVNLSLGTVHYKDRHVLRNVVNKAVKKGLIIIAACSNNNIITYPSCFSSVIGVKCDLDNELREGEYIYNYNACDGIDVTACCGHLLRKNNGDEFYSSICNSFATPLVTAKVCEIIKSNKKIMLEEIKLKLFEGATKRAGKVYTPYLYNKIDWIETAVVFKIGNAKIRSFKSCNEFKVVDVIYLNCDCLWYVLKDITDYLDKDYEILKEVDTVIIVVDTPLLKHIDCSFEDLLHEIAFRGKNIVYFNDNEKDSNLEFFNSKYNIKVWHPSIYRYLNFPVLKKIDIPPILVIYDFSGEYLIDLITELQECFRLEYYNIVSASDTCLGIVKEVEYLPLFKNGKLDHNGLKTVCGIYKPDIILYGIDASDKNAEYLNFIGKHFEVDVNIIISNNYNQVIEDLISSKEDNQVIFLTTLSFFCNKKNVTTFELSSNDYVNEIYSYIIDLYKAHND